MVNRFRNISELLRRVGISILLIVGLAAQPAVTVAITLCAADCPMHFDDAPDMDCCASMKTCSSSADATGAQHHSPGNTAGSACDDLSCFDLSTASVVVMSAAGAVPEGGAAGMYPGLTVEVSLPVAVSVVSPAFHQRFISPPVYKRMCVYLI